MSTVAAPAASVLFDAPGPRARARYRIYGVITLALVLLLMAYVVVKLAQTGQFDGRKWSAFEYSFVQTTLLHGLLNTLRAAAVAAVLALLLGTVLAAGRISDKAWLRSPSFTVVELFRALPVVVMMFFFGYGLQLSPFVAVVIALTLYNGSVLAEIFRAGIASVPRGQAEAGYALGLRKGQVVRLVLLPQGIRAMLPAIISQLVVLLKDTAIGFLITYRELLTEGRQLTTQPEFDYPTIPVLIVVAAIYISLCLTLSSLATWIERRSRRAVRSAASPVDGAAVGEVGAMP